MALRSRDTQALRVGEQRAIPREAVFEFRGWDMPRLASVMWPPLLAMGLMGVMAALAAGAYEAAVVEQQEARAEFDAWVPSLGFMSVGFLLSAITFALAHVMGTLRDGGTAVQQSLGERPLILKRPWQGWIFPILMMMGLMTVIAAFVISLVQAAEAQFAAGAAAEMAGPGEDYQDIGAWNGPLRFAGVLMIFTAIVLALSMIVKGIRFQADRILEIGERHQADAVEREIP